MGSKLHFNIGANVSNNKGVITKFDNPKGLLSSFYEAEEIGEIWGYHVDGQFQSDEEAMDYQNKFNNPQTDLIKVYSRILENGNKKLNHLKAGDIKIVDINGDGKLGNGDQTLENPGDRVRIGNVMPRFPFGFNISANWKQFDISISGSGVAKQDWYPVGYIYWGTYIKPSGNFQRKDLYEQAWDPEATDNSNNIYPQTFRGYSAYSGGRSLFLNNDYYLTNVGYMRIDNLTIGYSLPKAVTERLSIKEFRIFLSGENIFTWRFGDLTKYLDPEQISSRRISYSNPKNVSTMPKLLNTENYPMNKAFSIGVKIDI
jgi:hypothetical protein